MHTTRVDPSFWKGKRVFLTGHTGFKGSWLSIWLHTMGAELRGFALPPPTHPSLFEQAGLGKLMGSIEGDVTDRGHLLKSVREFQPEIVLHLAAQPLVRLSYEDPVGTYTTNVLGTVHILEAVRQAPSVKTFVNVTSDKCYENREWPWGYRENEAMGGYDPYSSSKGCAELVTAAYRRSFFQGSRKIGIASGRAGNVIGGGDWAKDRLIPDFIRATLSGQPTTIRNPHSVRPWQHVLEPLGGYLQLAERLHEDPEAFSEGWNFGPEDQDAISVGEVMDRLVKNWGAGAAWINAAGNQTAPHEAGLLKLDISKSRRQLGWRPLLPLSTALEWVATWYQTARDQRDMLPLTREQIERYQALM